ncbi:hypothetical protein DSM16313_22170 [Acinetobacter seohaensis]|nr:hypothetical protein DSM16313_22170 [Acinetobacter seohaensis]
MVVHLFLNNNKALDFLPINSIKNGGITNPRLLKEYREKVAKKRYLKRKGKKRRLEDA